MLRTRGGGGFHCISCDAPMELFRSLTEILNRMRLHRVYRLLG